MARASVLVTPSAGASSAAAHFMPRNAAVILVNKDGLCKNYGYFGGLGYVRPFFVSDVSVRELADSSCFRTP